MGKQDEGPGRQLAAVSKALAHPLRVHILIRVAERGTLSARQYEAETDEQLNLVAYHLRVLAKYKAIELAHTRQRRGATESFWKVAEDSPIIHALLGSQFMNAPDQPANGTSGILGGLLGPAGGSTQVSHMVPMKLDTAGVEELKQAVKGEIGGILEKIAERASLRVGDTGAEADDFHVGIAAFTWDKAQESRRKKKRQRGERPNGN